MKIEMAKLSFQKVLLCSGVKSGGELQELIECSACLLTTMVSP